MDNLFWRDEEETEAQFEVPDDIVDLSFRLEGSRLQIDHAGALAEALEEMLGASTCARIGVHGVHMASSGNGWNRPEPPDTEMPLSRRARLVIRCHRDDHDQVSDIRGKTLRLGGHTIRVGEFSERKLSLLGDLHARAICCDPEQSEPDFLARVAAELKQIDIVVARMICGRSGSVRTGSSTLFTRALLIAGLKPEESVRLQRQGLGEGRLLGCGLFVPHKGIDAVYTPQE